MARPVPDGFITSPPQRASRPRSAVAVRSSSRFICLNLRCAGAIPLRPEGRRNIPQPGAPCRARSGTHESTKEADMRTSILAGVLIGILSPLPTGRAPVPGDQARAAFERIKALAGNWEGRSTKGWVETLRYEVIAGGSTVLETSEDAHP